MNLCSVRILQPHIEPIFIGIVALPQIHLSLQWLFNLLRFNDTVLDFLHRGECASHSQIIFCFDLQVSFNTLSQVIYLDAELTNHVSNVFIIEPLIFIFLRHGCISCVLFLVNHMVTFNYFFELHRHFLRFLNLLKLFSRIIMFAAILVQCLKRW